MILFFDTLLIYVVLEMVKCMYLYFYKYHGLCVCDSHKYHKSNYTYDDILFYVPENEMASSNGNFSVTMHVLKGRNYDDWCVQMKVIFRLQDVTKVVQEGVQEPERNPIDAQHCLSFINV